MNSPIQIDRRITYDDLDFREECDEILWDKIKVLYDDVVHRINESDDKFMKITLSGHTEMYENRVGWDECEKTVRRKRLIIEWHNMQIFKLEEENENEETPMATDSPSDSI